MTIEHYIQFRIGAGQLSTFDATGTQSYLGPAYSGAPGYVNDIGAVQLKGLGPIPPGWYTIGADTGSKGPLSLPLTPDPETRTFDRGSFFIHGRNAAEDEDQALQESIPASSEGCICADHQPRAVAATFRRCLVVP